MNENLFFSVMLSSSLFFFILQILYKIMNTEATYTYSNDLDFNNNSNLYGVNSIVRYSSHTEVFQENSFSTSYDNDNLKYFFTNTNERQNFMCNKL